MSHRSTRAKLQSSSLHKGSSRKPSPFDGRATPAGTKCSLAQVLARHNARFPLSGPLAAVLARGLESHLTQEDRFENGPPWLREARRVTIVAVRR
jgi:hypothetical protein